jgi:hypothetical protein
VHRFCLPIRTVEPIPLEIAQSWGDVEIHGSAIAVASRDSSYVVPRARKVGELGGEEGGRATPGVEQHYAETEGLYCDVPIDWVRESGRDQDCDVIRV